MCGIFAILGIDVSDVQNFIKAYTSIHHRGPDAWRIENDFHFKNCCLGFHRLAIVDDMFGMQPMRIKSLPHLWLICNGEIYNCNRLRDQFDFKYETRCDVEAILHLYAAGGIEYCASQLDGVFAFCLLDTDKNKVYVARDTYGVRPAFQLTDDNGFLAVASEAKALIDLSKGLPGKFAINPVMPGNYQEYNLLKGGAVEFVSSAPFHVIGDRPKYQCLVPWEDLDPTDVYANIRKLFKAAVKKRLMAHRRIGCLLSGGLDSSLVAGLLLELAKEENITYPIQTFAVGMHDSPDIVAARKAAKHIGSEHHEAIFTEKDVIEALDQVIYHLECFDITTVRASIGMYLVSKFISKMTDTIVIFSGEGSDELAQGYIYFRDAPSAEEADLESRRLLKDLYLYDVLRSDRTTAAHGLEMRVPFLDHQFTSYYLSLPLKQRQPLDGVEKYVLRQAFEGTGLLPHEILWRHKEAFSDGVASVKKSLFTVLQDHAASQIDDAELAAAATLYPNNTPKTKESLYYRKVFERHYPGQHHFTPYMWMPRWSDATDPSARFINHYAAGEEVNGVGDK